MDWWVISFNPPSGTSTYQIFQGTQAQAQAKAQAAVDGSLDGPFATKAEAQAAAKGAGGQPVGTPEPAPNPNLGKIERDIPVIGPALQTAQELQTAGSGVAAAAAAVAEFFAALTHVETWRSIGWIVLGAILVIAGIYLWLKQNDLIPQTTPVPVPVPL